MSEFVMTLAVSFLIFALAFVLFVGAVFALTEVAKGCRIDIKIEKIDGQKADE